jgi:hypothetical protein
LDTKKKEVTSWWNDSIAPWWGNKALAVGHFLDTKKKEVTSWWNDSIAPWWGNKALAVGHFLDTKKKEVTSWWNDSIAPWWGNKALSVGHFIETKKKDVTSWWNDSIAPWWGNKALSVDTFFSTTLDTVRGWIGNVQKWWSDNFHLEIPKLNFHVEYQTEGLNFFQRSIVNALDLNGWPSLSFFANGGVFSGGTWHPVTAYAGGGMPASAQLFMAREAGPELVGTIGNHSAVVNNDQIVSSVASGVYRAVASAMLVTNANNSQSSGQPIYVYVGGKQITDYVVKDVNNRTLATGQCPIKV